MTKNKIIISGLSIALIVGFGISKTTDAADPSVYISPANLNKKVGDTFNIYVMVNPNGEKVCVVEGKLNLNKLSCQKVTMGSGISAQASPSCDDLNFLFGIQGCTTSNKTLFTVIVKAKNTGTGTANFTGIDIIGEGVSISSISSGGTYTIISTPSCNCNSWGSWQNQACGNGSCSSTQRLQTRTRTCTPSGCNIESEARCISDQGCFVSEGQEVSGELEGEKPGPLSEKEKRIASVREIPRKSLLASLVIGFGMIGESAVLTSVVILCLVVLALVGFREWTLVRERKRNSE